MSEGARRGAAAETPFAVTVRDRGAERLACLNPAAEARGLMRGQGLADARAICPDLTTHPADPLAQGALLAALARWLGRHAPRVAVEPPDMLTADIRGVAHLFGGEAAMAAMLPTRLARHGLTAGAGIADTPGAARALARQGGGIAPAGRTAAALAPLPLAALGCDPAELEVFARLGLETVGEVLGLPRAQLGRRFGPDLIARLDRATGRLPEPLAPSPGPEHFGARLSLPEPIGLLADVEAGLLRLLVPLCARLERRHRGARHLRLDLRRVDGAAVAVEMGLARPMRDPARLLALFRPRLEGVEAGFGIDALRLVATRTEPLPPEQIAGGPAGDEALVDLVTRLSGRLGAGQVLRYRRQETHVPERAFALVPALGDPCPPDGDWPPGPARPLLLFAPEPVACPPDPAPPRRFAWRRMTMETLRAAGPERIAPEWWRPDPGWRSGPRDYWRIETAGGRRLWMFHTPLAPGWHVQGEFA